MNCFFGCALFSLCSYDSSCILIAERSIMFVINKLLVPLVRSPVLSLSDGDTEADLNRAFTAVSMEYYPREKVIT